MAAINDLIKQIKDDNLRQQIEAELRKVMKHKRFGLVFEDHLPEGLNDGPIYPGLEVIDWVIGARSSSPASQSCADGDIRAPSDTPWHALIQADNYYALQLLAYLYPASVDCIYIDPPYNTGAKDWKYNNDYVDTADTYRHSKWLSMMNIDEKEYLHLGCLLEELFPEARMQMVSSVINPKGVTRNGFRRGDEYIYFIMFGEATPQRLFLGDEWSLSTNVKEKKKESNITPDWTSMMRRGSHSSRRERPGLYYAIYADPLSKTIKKIGEPLPLEIDKDQDIDGLVQILPLRSNGSQGCWQVGPIELKQRINQGRIRLGKPTSYGFVVNYLPDGAYAEVISENFCIEGRANDGSLIAYKVTDEDSRIAPTQWKIASHNASEQGSTLLGKIIFQNHSMQSMMPFVSLLPTNPTRS